MTALRIGLSGGIGAGKSTVAKAMVARGAHLVDADVIAREVVAPGSVGLARLVEAFGDDILAADGSLDRAGLAAKAFADDEQRARLNGIVHPLVGARTEELVAAAPDGSIVLQDIPLLVEGGMAPLFHLVMIVHADEGERLTRLTEQRGMSADDAQARIRAQATDDQRREVADIWLDNTGAHSDLASRVDELWETRFAPYADNVREQTPYVPPIVLVEHDNRWEAAGQRLVNRIAGLVGDVAVRVDHVGATAVPDVLAQDVIDVQVSVASAEDTAVAGERLRAGGFFPITPDVDDTDTHAGLVFASADPGRACRVAIAVDGSAAQRFSLGFVQWLTADAQARREYESVKKAAINGMRGRRERYGMVVGPYYDAMSDRVRAWADGPSTT